MRTGPVVQGITTGSAMAQAARVGSGNLVVSAAAGVKRGLRLLADQGERFVCSLRPVADNGISRLGTTGHH